jgi:ABC-2 type transport system ATP-binding protein
MGERYREKLSFQFQSQPFYPSYTAHDFLQFSALLKGMDEDKIEGEIKRVLDLVNLSENVNDKIKSFSGGMKQRLAIAQTILNSPEILIFDEPSAGLDPFEREQFKRIMMKMKERSIIIISTHIVSDIDTLCDSLVLLNKGSVVANDKPEILCEKIRGMVWDIPKEDIASLPYEKIYFEDAKSKTIAKTKPTEHAKLSEPTLNDLYFCGQIDKDIFTKFGGDGI